MTTEPDPKRPKRNRIRKWGIALVGALVVYALAGFLLVPAIVRSQLAGQLSERTGLKASVAKVRCNPFTLELEIEALALGPEGADVWLGFDRFHADLQLASVWRWELILRDVTVQRPQVLAHLEPSGQLNLLRLADRFPPSTNAEPAEPFSLPAALIQSMVISNAVVRWRDDAIRPGFESEVVASLWMTNFHTLETNFFRFEATLDRDTTLRAEGRVALLPSQVEVEASASDLRLGRYAAYVPDWSPLRLTSATVDARLQAQARISGEGLAASLDQGSVTVGGFRVERTNGVPVLEVGRTELAGIRADLSTRSAALRELRIEAPMLAAHRLTNGLVDWQLWAEEIRNHLPAREPDASSAPWTWSVDAIVVTNAVLRVADAAVSEPVALAVTNAWVAVRRLTNDLGQSLPVGLGFALDSGGRGTVSGEVVPVPLLADLDLEVTDVFLPVGAPYLAGVVNASLTNGFGSVAGKAQAKMGETNGIHVSFAGSLAARDVAVLEQESGDPLASVGRVDVGDVTASWPLEGLRIGSVVVAEPRASLKLREDGTSNVDDVVSRAVLEELWAQVSAVWHSLQFELDQLTVTNAAVALADLSVQPPFESGASDIVVELRGLQPKSEVPATVSVTGKVEGKAPFNVQAEFKPEGTNLTGKISVKTQVISLPPGSTYAGRWVGYLIDQGKVSVDLRYELDHKLIKGQNRVIIDDFEFGERTGSQEAIKLPVKLGVSLLKDRNNRIDLDVPIEGNLGDPQMKLSRVIGRAFGNIIEKAATAPFKFLGSLVSGGEDKDLSYVKFAPGESELAAAEQDKLETLAKALFERPQLKLEVVGRVDPAADEAAIRRRKFEESLRSFAEALPADAPFVKLAQALEMKEPPGREEQLTLLYVKTLEIPFQLPTNPPPETVLTNALTNAAMAVLTDAAATNAVGVKAEGSGEPEPEPVSTEVEEAPHRSWLARAWAAVRYFFRWRRGQPTVAEEPVEAAADAPAKQTADEVATNEVTTDASPPAEAAAVETVPVEPPPILPPLPDSKKMEAELLNRVVVEAAELNALAEERANAVQAFLLTQPEMTPDRITIAAELSGSEPAAEQARVFLGIR